jgi:nucleoside-diphosphate-sugar epimerase
LKGVAVTGATGFIGGHVVRALVARGDSVLAFGRREAPELEGIPAVSYCRWDIATGPINAPAVDAVVHCAGTVSDWGPDSLFQQVNVEGTDAVLGTFAGARRFVHVSTASVYDPLVPKRNVREDASYPDRYLNAYSRSKMLAEIAVRQLRPDAVILRPHAVYGRGDANLLPRLLAARRGGRQLLIGNGRNRISITHVANLTHGIERAVDGKVSGIFNVADPMSPTLDELIQTFLEAARLPPRVVHVPAWCAWPVGAVAETIWALTRQRRPPLITRYLVAQLAQEYTLDLTRARRILGYEPQVDYHGGIPDAVRDLTHDRSHPYLGNAA